MQLKAPARHHLTQGKSTHHECLKAIFTYRNIPKSVHTVTLVFKIWLVLLLTLKWTLPSFQWHFVGILYSEEHTQHVSTGQWFSSSSCALNASRLLITGSHLYLIRAQHLPKLPALIQEEAQNHRRILLQTESWCSAGTKITPLPGSQFGLDSSALIVEDTKRRRDSLHRVCECQASNDLTVMKELHCIFSQKQAQILLIMWVGWNIDTVL